MGGGGLLPSGVTSRYGDEGAWASQRKQERLKMLQWMPLNCILKKKKFNGNFSVMYILLQKHKCCNGQLRGLLAMSAITTLPGTPLSFSLYCWKELRRRKMNYVTCSRPSIHKWFRQHLTPGPSSAKTPCLHHYAASLGKWVLNCTLDYTRDISRLWFLNSYAKMSSQSHGKQESIP